jgi:hypothetical protein
VLKRIASLLAAIMALVLAPGMPQPARARRRLGLDDTSLPHLEDNSTAPVRTPFDGLWRLKDMPHWLHAIGRPEQLKTALERSIPAFASGAMALEDVRPRGIRLEDGSCGGMFELTFEGLGGARRMVRLRGVADPRPPARVDGVRTSMPFGEDGWRCTVPELHLVLETPPLDTALPALRILTDPSGARELLEAAMRAGSRAYADLRIAACTPEVARYKFGRRCTILYRLEYGPEAAGLGWPERVVAKTHRGSKGRAAYDGMRALWDSELRSSGAVTIAEPLAFLPELRVLIQRAVPQKSTLKDVLESVLPGGTAGAREELRGLLARTARGLAALHACSAHGRIFSLEQKMAEIRGRIVRLASWIPGLDAALEPTLARFEALAASHAPQRPVPSHHSFRPAQVLLHDGPVAFIDFDGFCEAEPAMDLALFRASLKQDVMRVGSREERPAPSPDLLSELDGLCDLFLDEYETIVPVSRERVALWETLYLLENVLNSWIKLEPQRLDGGMALLERHIRQSRLSLA